MLNLGLESYRGMGKSLPFTYTNVMTLTDKANALNAMVAWVDNYYEAARNAVAIRASVRKYGRTRSMEALVGTSAINTAMSFSMEGFWDTIKKAVRAVWEKIKEWALRFWHMMFSIEDRIKNTVKDLEGSDKGELKHEIVYEGADVDTVKGMTNSFGKLGSAMSRISAVAGQDNAAETIENVLKDFSNDDKFESYVTGMNITVTKKYTLKTKAETATRLKEYLAIIETASKIKDPLSKAIDSVLKAIDKARDDEKNDDQKDLLKRKCDAFEKAGSLITKLYSAGSSAATRDAAKVIAHIQYGDK